MAITDVAQFLDRLSTPFRYLTPSKNVASASGLLQSTWTRNYTAGSTPSTAAALDNTTTGSLDPLSRGPAPAGAAYLAQAKYIPQVAYGQTYILCDRLSHQGGLSGTNTTANLTTNLPTSALTRYTDGVGVMAAIEIYTNIGGTVSSISCTYTDTADSDQTSPARTLGGSGNQLNTNFLPIPLVPGGVGVKAIKDSTLNATTGTAGNFGYTLFKPLCMMQFMAHDDFTWRWPSTAGQLPEIADDACLFLLATTSNTIDAQIFTLIEV